MLEVRGIHTFYGQSHILFDVSLALKKGEIVGLLGRNGAGKTTTMKSVCGMLRPKEGAVVFEGEDVTGRKPFELVRRGICYVPDDRRIFADLSVEDNVRVGAEFGRASHRARAITFETLRRTGLDHLRDTPARNLGVGNLKLLEIARALAEPRQIRVELVVDDRPAVSGSNLHLRRVLLNIATNAITYSPAESTIRIRVARDKDMAVIVVRDEGCGIGADDLPHIFEPFYRTDPARARQTGGTGLGLAIADQIARAHGGRIQVSSELDHGSVFTVTLPLRELQ